jgi:hypothetical protein
MNVKGTLSSFLIFAAGAAIGSVVTWKFLETRYKKLVDEEVESMDEYYRNKYGVEGPEVEEEETREIDNQVDIREYAKTLVSQKYVNYSNVERDEEVNDVERPYVIPPEEFGELSGYETITLYYHSDGVLTDDQNEIVEDVDDVVGEDFSDHFGEYEDDSVFIRNDAKRVDYEILYDPSTYQSGINKKPHLAEDE